MVINITLLLQDNGMARINPFNSELNPICHLLALLGAHPILHISRIRVKKTNGKVMPPKGLMFLTRSLCFPLPLLRKLQDCTRAVQVNCILFRKGQH